jgi:hypothetical protein
MIVTLDIYATSNGRTSLEVPEDLIPNARKIIALVSELASLANFQIKDVTSGYRSASYNKQIGGSPTSKHCFAQAVDIADPDKTFGLWLGSNLEALKERGCAMESLTITHASDDPMGRWIHIQSIIPPSGHLIFLP